MTGVLPKGLRVVLFANTDWYLYNFRLALATTLRDRGCDVVMMAPPGKYADRFAAHGLRFVPFSFERLSVNPVHQASAVLRLARVYRRERPHLVHHFTIKCAVYGSLAARVSGRPAVVNALAGLGSVFAARGARFRYLRRVVLRTLRLALSGTQVIVQNPDDRAAMLASGLMRPEQTTLIGGSGVDLERFREADRPSGRRLRVLLASRLLRSKGIAVFEAAARELGGRADFLIAGVPDPGNPDTLLAPELEGLESRGAVQLLGHVEDMPALLSTVDLVVLPTTYGEGVPRILVEAAASGLPLVATDAPGCREIVRPGRNGLLVPAGDTGALSEAIGSLLADAPRRTLMGQASREIAGEFSEPLVLTRTFDVYARALRAAAGRPAAATS